MNNRAAFSFIVMYLLKSVRQMLIINSLLQADIAPLMSSLLGIPFPLNSVVSHGRRIS